VFSRAYVAPRISGVVRDDVWRLAEGERRNYRDVGAFVEVDDQWSLADERVGDVLDYIDRRRAFAAL
jgi:hypothetical protein